MDRKKDKLLKSIKAYKNLVARQRRDYKFDLSKPVNLKFEDFLPAGGKEAKLERKKMWIYHTRMSLNAEMVDLRFNDIEPNDLEIEGLIQEINNSELRDLR